MTADHAQEVAARALWAHRHRDEWAPESLPGQIITREVQIILAALRAERDALRERVEALADGWEPCLDRYLGSVACDHPGCVLADRLRALLADPSEA